MHLLVALHIKSVSSKKIVHKMNNKLKIIISIFMFD